MKCFIAGGAGFIGSNLTRRLIELGWDVTVYDNLSMGRRDFLKVCFKNKQFRFIKGDLLNSRLLHKYLKGHDVVFHFAANSDISLGTKETDLDMNNGFLSTYNILEGMRRHNIKKIVFTSSGSVYGEASKLSFREDDGPIFPLSLYAASKVASEAYISAFCNVYGIEAWIFRLANIIGPNATHGVIFDFINKLKKDPQNLQILGDGNQTKPYLYVDECIDGMLYAFHNSKDRLNYFNLTCHDTVNVKKIARIVIEVMGLKNVQLHYTGEETGWPGDQKKIKLNPSKINFLGWKARLSSEEAVRLAANKILEQRVYDYYQNAF